MRAINFLTTSWLGVKTFKTLAKKNGSAFLSELRAILRPLQKQVRKYGHPLQSLLSRILSRQRVLKCTSRSQGLQQSKTLEKKSNGLSTEKSSAKTYFQCSIEGELPTVAERLNDTSWL